MARVRVPITVIDNSGNGVNGAAVHVKHRLSGLTATVYQAETGPTTISNPMSTDSSGRVTGWVERGAYNADISGTGISNYTQPFDAAAAENRSVDGLWLPRTFVASAGALPSSPSDGDEVYYQADATNGVIWHLRYNAGSASTYKWEFIGGSPITAIDNTNAPTTASTTYVALTGDPSITLPRNGQYDIHYGCLMSITSAGSALSSLSIDGDAASDNDSVVAAGGVGGTAARELRATLDSTRVVVWRTRSSVTSAGTVTVQRRWLHICPVRVI